MNEICTEFTPEIPHSKHLSFCLFFSVSCLTYFALFFKLQRLLSFCMFGLFRFGTFVGYWFFSSEMISFYNPILSYSLSGICHCETMVSSILLEGHVCFVIFVHLFFCCYISVLSLNVLFLIVLSLKPCVS